MADKEEKDFGPPSAASPKNPPPYDGDVETRDGILQDEQTFRFQESRKLGVTSAVFLILNKMIGTGSEFKPHIPYRF
jgi:hypothetical protein